MTPVALSPDLIAGAPGPYFELRTYTTPLGQLDKLLETWARAMPRRDALGSPVGAIWTSPADDVHKLTHLWPYQSLAQREEIRKQVREGGKWPPYKEGDAAGHPPYEILSQQNKLLLPATFSPLQ